jgi:alpha-tubulin suppressor-like RCC1 family protein
MSVTDCGGTDSSDGPSGPGPETPTEPEPDHLAFIAQPTDEPLGVVFGPLQLEILDADGGRVTGSAVQVEITLESAAGQGTLRGTTSRSSVDGVVSFPDLWIDRSGTYRLRGTSIGLGPALSDQVEVSYKFRWISSRGGHACGLTTGDLVLCWGRNDFGELGVPESGPVGRPTQPDNPPSFAQLATGENHTCGLEASAAYCVGKNDEGQLGDGKILLSESSYRRVLGNHAFQAIGVGAYHSCALSTIGAAWCWGYLQGELSDTWTESDATEPVRVASEVSFTSLAVGGYRSCGLTNSGRAYCWGLSHFPAEPPGDSAWIPSPVAGDIEFRALSIAVSHTCGVDTQDRAWCWGVNDGRLGAGSEMDSPDPVEVAGGIAFQSTSAGVDHTCGVATDGTAYCWGDNAAGQLGIGSDVEGSTIPLPVSGGLRFESVSAGQGFTCGVTTESRAYCWGANGKGDLGRGDVGGANAYAPVAVVEPEL